MEKLTYEVYVRDPTLRERLHREARQARAEAIRHYIAKPFVALFRARVRNNPVPVRETRAA